MEKNEVILILKQMADVLEVADANSYEVMAYRNAAQALDEWSGDLQHTVENDEQGSIPTIGKAIGKVIADLVTTGRSDDYDRIGALVPAGLPALLKVRGLGPKRVRRLWQELGIENAADLKLSADEGRIEKLKGFGAKTVERIISGLEYAERPRSTKVKRTPAEVIMLPSTGSTGRVSCGMSGYSYAGWKGSFYPDDAKTKDLLEHYATRFTTVEINNTFYRFPTDKVIQQWMSQTPDDFQFAFKAHSRITHKLRLRPEVSQTIIDFVERCGQLGKKLGCILFQLPPDFRRDNTRLETLLSSLPTGPRYAVEFRHDSWLDERVFGKLKAHNISIVSGDFAGTDHFRQVTADFIYTRMRRDDYSTKELTKWSTWFQQQAETKRDVLAFFKHDDEGHAANQIAQLWGTPTATPKKLAASAKTRQTKKGKTG